MIKPRTSKGVALFIVGGAGRVQMGLDSVFQRLGASFVNSLCDRQVEVKGIESRYKMRLRERVLVLARQEIEARRAGAQRQRRPRY